MKVQQLTTVYLYEGLDRPTSASMMLWENAGYKLREAALSADQIQQLFKSIETSATDAGGNRTALGQGKDAVAAVNKAWEDLKTKMQTSGPVKGFDQKVSDVLSKIGMGAAEPEFNGKVNKWVQKYRDFATKHPIAQGAIYATLIALAGITGAGIGGAAALGLLKLADQALQGKRFSSAAYSGVKAGAMAYGASKLGDYLKGKMGGETPPGGADAGAGGADSISKGLAADQAFQDRLLNKFPSSEGYTFAARGKSLEVFDAAGRKVWTGDVPLKTMDMKTFADLTNAGKMATPGNSFGSISSDPLAGTGITKAADLPKGAAMSPDYLKGVVNGEITRPTISPEQAQAALNWQVQNGGQSTINLGATDPLANWSAAADKADRAAFAAQYGATNPDGTASDAMKRFMAAQQDMYKLYDKIPKKSESILSKGKKLSEGQIYMVFNRVCDRNDRLLSEGKLSEGPLDAIKGAAGKAMNWAKTKGKNLTTKVTADKLNSAWQKAGSPTDSAQLADFLKSQGVADTVISSVYQQLKLPAPGSAPAGQDIEDLKKTIASMSPEDKKALLNQLLKAA